MNRGDRANRRQREFDRAMAESAELLEPVLADVEPPRAADDFFVYELARLCQEGEPSFEDDEFRFLIRQGIRLEYEGDRELRASVVDRLRRRRTGLSGGAMKLTPLLIGAIEDTDFALDRVGAIVRHYTRHLFARLEGIVRIGPDEGFDGLVEKWRTGETNRERLMAGIGQAGVEATPGMVELMLETADDPEISGEVVARLAALCTHDGAAAREGAGIAVRALAFAVSEPVLQESVESRAFEALRTLWPAPRSYVLYHLRRHTHEDIPFRWIELLIVAGELRGVDRVLEEVLIHASDPGSRPDLLSLLDLTARSLDPGREGKVLRILEGPGVPDDARTLVWEWLAASPGAGFLRLARELHGEVGYDFVHLGEDFSAFASRFPDLDLTDIFRRWNQAYHEAFGWTQRAGVPRSEFETREEANLQEALVRHLPSGRPWGRAMDEAMLRQVFESIRENHLESPRDGFIPLVRIYRERPRGTVWLEDIYQREINDLYARASGAYDSGEPDRARRKLALLLEIEPGDALGNALDRLLRES